MFFLQKVEKSTIPKSSYIKMIIFVYLLDTWNKPTTTLKITAPSTKSTVPGNQQLILL